MFSSNVLDVAIALILAYLLLGLVVTAANELIATFNRSRARDLERGIRNLLDGKSSVPERFWRPIIRFFAGGGSPSAGRWSEAFFAHPLLNSLSKDGEKPTYVPASLFATVLLHLVENAKAVQETDGSPSLTNASSGLATFDQIRATLDKIETPGIRDALIPLLEQARADLSTGVTALRKFNDQVEAWFNNAMDRVSGWYQRRTRWMLFAIAVLFSAALNVDTVAICRQLSSDSVMRAAAVKTAEAYAAQQSSTPPTAQGLGDDQLGQNLEQVSSAVQGLDHLGIPLGWAGKQPVAVNAAIVPPSDKSQSSTSAMFYATKVFGLLVTAFAASLGAPFWFDVLNKFIAIRGVGKAPDEEPKTPKATQPS